MAPKKQRVQPLPFVSEACRLIKANGGRIRFDILLERMNLSHCDHVDSIISEHPSFRSECGYVTYVPAITISNQTELLSACETIFPRTLRKIDLVGTYPFVEADVDELIYEKKVTLLDPQTGSFTVLPRPAISFSEHAIALWEKTLE